mmetsp:Transcript_14110/g.27106  ORF Transcript_14110/g.27106 Transcript_14110/m.27106 type:complete len:507 (+) Transcript_14110:145-1665(+)|eukprot:CAMPEP_0114241736 /NCGR_PEP_ID=MMETSP0058-20121206/9790_1 /TAXON_ID=36894 /ORGANISM="Pyramimonas parkeae, CCMP726" /LENGTH=506 /DNA_ID=CAMNT_0001354279 /DNA_START=74 /DNA_END=1594 /DNA_ORIENTATION=-
MARPPPGSKAKAGYSYISLSDVPQALHTVQNLYGLVVDGHNPLPSKGSDFFCTVHITDGSLAYAGAGEIFASVEVRCFARTERELPRFQVGQVIRIHRANICSYNSKAQAVVQLGANKRSSFVLFHSQPQDGAGATEVAQASSASFTLEPKDQQLLASLRAYWSSVRMHYPAAHTPYLKTLAELSYTFLDLICKVVLVQEAGAGRRVLWVWDGQDEPASGASPPAQYMQAMAADPKCTHFFQHLQVFEPALEDIASWEELGSAVPVVLPSDLTHCPGLHQWVKLRNVAVWRHQGQWQLVYVSGSKWLQFDHLASGELSRVQQSVQRRRERNEVATWAPANMLECITRTMHPNVRYSTLRSVLQAQHTAKYRCLARVVGHRPSLVHRFCLSLRPRDNPDVGDAAQAGRAQWVYAVSLTLQDATASLVVHLFAADGETFFQGLSACNVAECSATSAGLTHKMDTLLGPWTSSDGTQDSRNPPWIQCCIKAYLDIDNVRRYRMFDTVLL